jgi:hypothetical protein
MVEPGGDGSTGLPKAIRRAVWVFLALCAACLFAEAVSRLKHYGFPYVWPLMSPYSAFSDFTFFAPHAATFHRKAFFDTEINYPATLACLLEFFYVLPWPLGIFLCAIVLSFAVAGVLFGRALRRAGVPGAGTALLLSVFVLSFPLWFELERANAEAAVWVVVSIGIWAFLRDRRYLAGICFGVAGTMKIFPLVFFGLLLSRKQYRPIAAACACSLGLLAICLWLESGSLMGSWLGGAAAAEPFRTNYLLKTDSSGFDHSIFALIKQSVGGHHRSPALAHTFEVILTRYMALAAVGGVALYFTRIKKMPILNQVMALTVASILLPPISYDYTLIYLYVPCGMLVLSVIRAGRNRATSIAVSVALIAFAVLLAPETEVIAQRVSLGGDIKCVTLFVLFFLSLCYRFEGMGETVGTA